MRGVRRPSAARSAESESSRRFVVRAAGHRRLKAPTIGLIATGVACIRAIRGEFIRAWTRRTREDAEEGITLFLCVLPPARAVLYLKTGRSMAWRRDGL